MKKKLYKVLSIIWKIIGIAILVLFVYTFMKIDQGIVDDTLILILALSLLLYSVITLIDFLSPGLVKLFRKLKKRILKK
jgi:hypothetical protein